MAVKQAPSKGKGGMAPRAKGGPKRIVVTGDFLRPIDIAAPSKAGSNFRPSQTENIEWFHRLIRRRLVEASGLPVDSIAWNLGIDTPAIYEVLRIDQDIYGWVEAFSFREQPSALLALLDAAFGDSIVISFEMATSIKTALTTLDIPWIDLNIHPVRFLPDVFFAVQTNHPGIFERLAAHHMPEANCYDWADILAASARKLPAARNNTPFPCKTLLVGQTDIDRSLIVDGRLCNLATFENRLLAILPPGGSVLYKEHPYARSDFGLFECGLSFNSIIWTKANAYALLADPSLAHVVGISSSILLEARYFGKTATALAPLPFDIPTRADQAAIHQHISIYDGAFVTDFWRGILEPVTPTTRPDGHTFHRPPNTLRTSLRNFWGYNEMTTDFPAELYHRGLSGR